MDCCSGNDEEIPVLSVQQDEFRCRRKAEDFQNHKLLKQILKHICATLYKPSRRGLIVSIFVAIICVFQFAFTIAMVTGCPDFDCGFPEKKFEGDNYVNRSHITPYAKAWDTVNALASIGGLFSYSFLLISIWNMHRRRQQGNGQAISPSDALFNDLSNTQVKYIFLSIMTITVMFVSAVMMGCHLISTQPWEGWHYYLMIIGVAAMLVTQWTAAVGYHAFAIPCLALGGL